MELLKTLAMKVLNALCTTVFDDDSEVWKHEQAANSLSVRARKQGRDPHGF